MRFDIEDLSLYDDAGEADFIDVFDFRNAEVIEDSSPEQSVQGDEAWWFSNLPLSSSKPKQQFFAEKTATAWDFQPSGLILCFLECHKLGKVRFFFWGGGWVGVF